jgi:hypothetical protein
LPATSLQLSTYMQYDISSEASSSSASQEIPRILYKATVHYRVHNIPPIIPVLSPISPFHCLRSDPIQPASEYHPPERRRFLQPDRKKKPQVDHKRYGNEPGTGRKTYDLRRNIQSLGLLCFLFYIRLPMKNCMHSSSSL